LPIAVQGRFFYGRTEKNPRSLPPADLPAIAALNDGASVSQNNFCSGFAALFYGNTIQAFSAECTIWG